MAQSVIRSPMVYQLEGNDFFGTFKLQPEEVIDSGVCGEIILAAYLTKPNIKRVVKKFTLLDDETKERNKEVFHAEVQFMQSFDHPFVMKCLIAGHGPEYMAYSMHYYRRGTLNDYVGNLSSELTELCITQTACALRYLHKNNIVHCDVKLDNIFIDDDFNAILGDFGLAVELFPHQQMVPTKLCGGTRAYFPPERINAAVDKELDPFKLDAYCLGVVLWALIMERDPEENIDYYFETRRKRDLPSNVRNWLLKLLERHPARRITIEGFLRIVKREGALRHVIDKY